MRKFLTLIAVSYLLLAAPVAANAQQAAGSDWQFKLGTFFWAADADLTLEAPERTVSGTADFADLMENSVPSINLTFEAKKDKLAFHTNFFNFHLKKDFYPSDGGGTRGTKMDLYIPEAFVSYDVLKTDLSDTVKLSLAPYAGVRYFNNRIVIDNVGGGEWRDVHKSATDAIFGLMATIGFGEKLSLTLRGDAGGFGWGGESNDSDYFGMAALNWNYAKNRTLSLGYADMKITRDNVGPQGNIDTEIEMKGPIMSHTFKF